RLWLWSRLPIGEPWKRRFICCRPRRTPRVCARRLTSLRRAAAPSVTLSSREAHFCGACLGGLLVLAAVGSEHARASEPPHQGVHAHTVPRHREARAA